MWTLRVAVTGPIPGASLVVSNIQATIGGHGDQGESAIETTRKLRNVHIKGELLVGGPEQLVSAVVLEEEDTSGDVRREGGFGDVFHPEGITARGNTEVI